MLVLTILRVFIQTDRIRAMEQFFLRLQACGLTDDGNQTVCTDQYVCSFCILMCVVCRPLQCLPNSPQTQVFHPSFLCELDVLVDGLRYECG